MRAHLLRFRVVVENKVQASLLRLPRSHKHGTHYSNVALDHRRYLMISSAKSSRQIKSTARWFAKRRSQMSHAKFLTTLSNENQDSIITLNPKLIAQIVDRAKQYPEKYPLSKIMCIIHRSFPEA